VRGGRWGAVRAPRGCSSAVSPAGLFLTAAQVHQALAGGSNNGPYSNAGCIVPCKDFYFLARCLACKCKDARARPPQGLDCGGVARRAFNISFVCASYCSRQKNRHRSGSCKTIHRGKKNQRRARVHSRRRRSAPAHCLPPGEKKRDSEKS
jgi:hypothetical protein